MATERDLTLPGLIHDLNNVFQALVDAADLLQDDPRWIKLSSAILRSVERGHHISASLAANGEGSASFETILANAISFVEDSTVRTRRRATIRFTEQIDPGIELRHGWAWERVLINLFLNSRRAMPKGGTIHVRAMRKAPGIEVTVRDDGTGIPLRLLDSLFEPHVSGHGSSGLGLHIVRTIVEQDGGTVQAKNLNPGAEFVMRLPLSATVPVKRTMVRAAGD